MVKDLNDPTNVDTVPAMLTEGEFVLNKEATQMFGPIIEEMNRAGLLQRKQENEVMTANVGKKVSKLHGEGYTAPGQAYAIAKSMGYNTGGLVDFLKKEEGYKDKAYQDQAGVWTIGYGRTTNPDGSPIRPGQTTNREKEDSWLDQRAADERSAVDQYAETYGYDWSDGQKDALASFRYNVGNLDQLTAKGTRTNDEIQTMIPEYNKAGGEVSKGLQNRRAAELELWGAKPSAPPPDEEPPVVATEEVGPESMFPEEGGGPGGFGLGDIAGLLNPQGPAVPAPMLGLSGQNPEYIPSVAAKAPSAMRKNEYGITEYDTFGSWNEGGPVQYLRNGGRANITEEERERRRLARLAGAGNVSRGRNEARQAPRIAPTAPPQPMPGPSGRNVGRAGVSASDPFVQQYPDMFDVGPVPSQEVPPQIDDQPPVPGSDEAILQGSSQAVEAQEDWQSMVDPQDMAAAGLDPSGNLASSGSGAIDSGIIGPDSVPSPEYVDAQIEGGFTSPEQVQAAQDYMGPVPPQPGEPPQIPGTAGAAIAAESEQAPEVDVTPPFQDKTPDEQINTINGVKGVVETTSKDEPPMKDQAPPEQMISTGREEMKDPQKKGLAASALKEAFGDLINPSELLRMGVVFLGALATGATPGQALSISGQMYLGRIDAIQAGKQSTEQNLLKSGKYTPESIKAYTESGDASVLERTGSPITRTGKFKDVYDRRTGKAIRVEEVKNGDNVGYIGQDGKVISGFDITEDGASVEGTPEYFQKVQQIQGDVTSQVKSLREQFDVFETDEGKMSKTDINPETQGPEIAKWALKNGVKPQDVGGLVEAAYHDMVNEYRQDGSRPRSIVPYLRQLTIRQATGHPDAFLLQDQPDKGPKQYIAAEKLSKLNNDAAYVMKSKGLQGNTRDLSNQLYTAGLSDWQKLDPATKKVYQRKAGKGENGFFVFLQSKIANYL